MVLTFTSLRKKKKPDDKKNFECNMRVQMRQPISLIVASALTGCDIGVQFSASPSVVAFTIYVDHGF